MNISLNSLTLKNFKGIKDLTINFEENTNIYGDNGTGKTTIFDSFMWLLFDKDSSDRKDFEIKTLDKNNEVIHGLDHQVTGSLNVDGKEVVLTKIYKEKWTKRRGEAERQLTGHEALYYIDEVPVKKGEYQDKINSFINENLFKLLSNPLYFSTNMKWQDRRSVLLEIIGDVTTDRVINYKTDLRPLKKLLADKDIDTLKKTVAARKKKLNDDIKSIPYRIDECHNSIKEIDFKALEFRKKGIQSGISSIDEQLIDSSKVNEEILKEKDKLFQFKSQLKDIEFKAKNDSDKPLKEMNSNLYTVKSQLQETNYKIKSLESKRDNTLNQITSLKKDMEELRVNWTKENERTLEFDEKLGICPTCQRPLEEHDIDAKKHAMEENFNFTKSNKLKTISEKGMAKKKQVDELETLASSLTEEIIPLNEKVAELESNQLELESNIKDFVPSLNLESNEEYQSLLSQIQELENKLSQPTEANSQIAELKAKKVELEKELDEVNSQLAYKEQNETLKERIQKLQDEEKKLAQQIAELEGQEFLCEEFIKTKVELLESSINSKFKFVRFKLFDTQVNGGLVETCEALINGVPFNNANTASQINAGLDIINALSEHYKVSAPIFIDNRESVNKIIECNSQVINLIVSSDKTLQVKNNESEVA